MIGNACHRGATSPLLFVLLGSCTAAPRPGTAERLYVLDVGECRTTDVSRWSPGVEVGKPWVFANHCYLIRHARGLLLWDTGFSDQLAELADGLSMAGGQVHIRVTHPLAAQLGALGVRPTDVTHLALSHFHMDHAGNTKLFPAATLYVQEPEFAAAFGPAPRSCCRATSPTSAPTGTTAARRRATSTARSRCAAWSGSPPSSPRTTRRS